MTLLLIAAAVLILVLIGFIIYLLRIVCSIAPKF